MKQDPNHLPPRKQFELRLIVETLRQHCNEVEKIILFGSYARGDYLEAKDIEDEETDFGRVPTSHISDYDVLLVTRTREVAENFDRETIEDKLESKLSAPLQILAFDIGTLNERLEVGQYFYSDIIKEGFLLYDAKTTKLARKRKLTAPEQYRIALNYYQESLEASQRFLRYFRIGIEENDVKRAAFHLHQAAEHAYKTMILVHTLHNPQGHRLIELASKVKKYHPDLSALFPHKTPVEKRQFYLLEYAYIGGRYDPDYYISPKSLEFFAIEVKKLISITSDVCLKRLASFGSV